MPRVSKQRGGGAVKRVEKEEKSLWVIVIKSVLVFANENGDVPAGYDAV